MTDKDPLDADLDMFESLLKKLDAAIADTKTLQADMTKSFMAHAPADIPSSKIIDRVAAVASALGPSRTNALACLSYGALEAFKTGLDVEPIRALVAEMFEAASKLGTMKESREAYLARNAEAKAQAAAVKQSPAALLVPGNGQIH